MDYKRILQNNKVLNIYTLGKKAIIHQVTSMLAQAPADKR